MQSREVEVVVEKLSAASSRIHRGAVDQARIVCLRKSQALMILCRQIPRDRQAAVSKTSLSEVV